MSKYIIHKIPVDISDDKREEYIQYMKNISNNDNGHECSKHRHK